MPTTITSAGVTFNDTTTLTSANIGTAQLVNGSVTAEKLGTTEQKQICKAWVNFNGTLATPITPRASFNVSSVTKNGNGNYTVNFASALADANYSWSGSVDGFGNNTNGAFIGLGPTITYPIVKTTSSLRVIVQDNGAAATDGSQVSITVFGN